LERSRVAVEKPFGHDPGSARELNGRLRAVLAEDQIPRVDHFLGKHPVVELEYLRFANQALAELVGPPQHLRDPHHHGRRLRGGGPAKGCPRK
jgi:glucose-6-phosphate 1-dehydrogenase